ncbi:ATP-binding protein [Cryptosporangium sp. NPDC048952]|uniref:sensor histidine kinase n=1 Tax=Cryptosporangium sp. NPDC048952 TaxID=3363961 RepID=UPI00371495D7
MPEHRGDRVSCDSQSLDDPEAVLAAALDAYIGFKSDGRVVAWNPAAEKTFGYSRTEACGQRLADLIIPPQDRDRHVAALADLAAGDPDGLLGQRQERTVRHQDGREFPVEIAITATGSPDVSDGQRFHMFAHDATTVVRTRRFAAVEAAVARGMVEASSSTEAARRVVDALGTQMRWPVAELWLTDDERQMLACAGRHVAPGWKLGGFALSEIEPGVGLAGRVYQQARPDWIPDLAADLRSARSRAADAAGLHVAVGVPIRTGGQTLGALCVYGDWIEDPEDTLITLLTGLAAQVGQYLERRRAEELAVELAHTKDEFLALVTHELRNPLTVIVSTAELLEDDLAELTVAEQYEHLRTITRSAHRMVVIANDLLDLARLESGHLAVHPADTDLCLIMRESAHAHTAQIEAKNLTLGIELPERLELHADADRLRQVADNLLSNAIKYTPAGGTITLSAAAGDTPDGITWSVADTGIGIPAADRPRLFRRFYRASTAVDRRIPGTGLGLVITRAIIDRHQGSIELTDHPGPGTTFTIHLPTKPGQDGPLA